MNRSACEECAAISQELAETYEEAWFASDQDFRDAWLARNNLIGCTEDDVLRAEACSPKPGRTDLQKSALPLEKS